MRFNDEKRTVGDHKGNVGITSSELKDVEDRYTAKENSIHNELLYRHLQEAMRLKTDEDRAKAMMTAVERDKELTELRTKAEIAQVQQKYDAELEELKEKKDKSSQDHKVALNRRKYNINIAII